MSNFSIIIGLLLIVLAVFAKQLGVDNDSQWGSTRYGLLYTGLTFCLLYAALRLLHVFHLSEHLQIVVLKFSHRRRAAIETLTYPVRFILHHTIFSVIAALLVLLITSIYAFWYTSQGYFPTFPTRYNPYVELGDAFLHGQVALLEQPDLRLIALKDPVNDLAARQDIPYHYDLSYYQGKYYAYWGPVPAFLNAAIQAVFGEKPPGSVAPLIFYVCAGLAQIIILFIARQWAFPHAPAISVALFVLAALINLPYVFMLSRNDVYETAILAGQCFLFIGLSGWLAYLVSHRPGWLILAGTGYALAVGSRYNLALAVLVCLGFAAWQFQREGFFSRAGLRRAVLLLTPLALVAVLLAFYNTARFGNPLQTGLQYQLADPQFQKQYYSPSFIFSNLYVYLFNPATFRPFFPFIITVAFQPETLPLWAHIVPGKEFETAMLGGLSLNPIFWMLVVICPLLVPPFWHKRAATANTSAGLRNPDIRRFVLMLTLAGIMEAIHMLFYYYGAMRFIADFYALFLIALVFASWQVDDRLACSLSPFARTFRVWFWIGAAALALSTALIGFLTGFEVHPQVFRMANADLYNQIAQSFNQPMNYLITESYRIIDGPTLIGTILRIMIKNIPFLQYLYQ